MRQDEPAGDHDGIGQSLWDDILFLARFWRSRRQPMAWRKPDDSDRRRHGPGSLADRFGDDVTAACDVDGRHWIVVERWWFGWPDPPRFAVFAFNADGGLWLARDFNTWPSQWTIDDANKT